jgi:FKBP-type peptidyl-prolyl cis-trans isomerase (trigger factor)
MSQNQLSFDSQIRIYDHENLIQNVFKLIQKEVLENNFQLIQKYDRGMVNSSLAKATRHKHLKMILSLSRLLKKDWITITKEDVEDLVYKVMEKYGDESGQETNTTWDHKKVLKIFVRWIKL